MQIATMCVSTEANYIYFRTTGDDSRLHVRLRFRIDDVDPSTAWLDDAEFEEELEALSPDERKARLSAVPGQQPIAVRQQSCLKRERYSVKYLLLIAKATSMSTSVTLLLAKDYVLVLRYKVGTLGNITFCLAQQIDTEEESGEQLIIDMQSEEEKESKAAEGKAAKPRARRPRQPKPAAAAPAPPAPVPPPPLIAAPPLVAAQPMDLDENETASPPVPPVAERKKSRADDGGGSLFSGAHLPVPRGLSPAASAPTPNVNTVLMGGAAAAAAARRRHPAANANAGSGAGSGAGSAAGSGAGSGAGPGPSMSDVGFLPAIPENGSLLDMMQMPVLTPTPSTKKRQRKDRDDDEQKSKRKRS